MSHSAKPRTRQGVRDLDAELGPRPSQGRRLAPPPRQSPITGFNSSGSCYHRKTYWQGPFHFCDNCGAQLERDTSDVYHFYDGRP